MGDTKKLKAPLDDGASDHITPGTMLPSVRLRATDGNEFCLADHHGRLVLFVYPWTGRPDRPDPPHWDEIPGAHGSTPEIEGFRHLVGDFAEFDIAIFGLSNQTLDYQREMVERLNVPFPILSDADGRFAATLRLPSFETGGVKYLKRLSIVACNGRVEIVFYPVKKPEAHARDVLKWFQKETRR